MSISGVHAVNNNAVVKLGQMMQLNKVHVPAGKYDTHTTGEIVYVDADEEHQRFISLKGKMVYFSEFKEGTKFVVEGIEYAFIKLDDIEGFIE